MAIETQLKQRLVGIAVIVSLAVIFLPMILDGAGMIEEDAYEQAAFEVPPPPKVERRAIDFDERAQRMDARLKAIPKLSHDIVDEANRKQDITKKTSIIKQSDEIVKPKKVVNKIGGDSWIVQLGSFKDQDKAFKLQEKVRAYKIAAVFIQKVMLKNGKSYRVRLGPFLYQKQAQAAVEKLIKRHKLKAVVMKLINKFRFY